MQIGEKVKTIVKIGQRRSTKVKRTLKKKYSYSAKKSVLSLDIDLNRFAKRAMLTLQQ